MKKWIALSGLTVIGVLVAIQFVPVTTANPVVLKNSAASISGHIPGWYILEHAMTSLPPA
jgi:hypothetical protein